MEASSPAPLKARGSDFVACDGLRARKDCRGHRKELAVRSRRVASLMLLVGIVSLTGCGPLRKGGQAGETDGVIFEKGAAILTGSALTDGSGSVLAAMMGKVPNFRVQQHTGRCPEISLRNNVSLQ